MSGLEVSEETEEGSTWDETTNALLDGWIKDWERTARRHSKWAQIYHLAHGALALPAVLLPMLFSQIDMSKELGYMTCSALVGVLTFLNMAATGQQHRQAMYVYNGLRFDLIAEKARPPGARRPAPYAIADFKARAQQALMAGPAVPLACLWPLKD